MADTTFVELVTAAHEYLTACQAQLKAEFRLGAYERFEVVDGGRALEFCSGGVAYVRAEVQFVGSVSRTSGTWLWGWANSDVEPTVVEDMRDVRLYGAAHEVWQLTTPKWEADEVDGWEMAAIAAYILRARGAYRAPYEHVFSFLTFRSLRWLRPLPAAV
jgi:hypothetical protein